MTTINNKIVVVFPNAKVNIGLNITSKRPDGFHNIESCFYPIPFTDALEVIESKELSFTSSGISIPGNSDDNLCLKAYHLLNQIHNLPPVAIHLHKNIPIGAGLGGGSSDGAFMIKLLNEKFNLEISLEEQESLAGQLGSDCPFFIRNKPVYVEGTGNIFSEINLSLKGKYLVLIMPSIHVSSADAYNGIIPSKPLKVLKQVLESSTAEAYQGTVENDFEKSVFKQYPTLVQLKNELVKQGVVYASMSGSGSSIFGLFEKEPKISFDYFHQIMKL